MKVDEILTTGEIIGASPQFQLFPCVHVVVAHVGQWMRKLPTKTKTLKNLTCAAVPIMMLQFMLPAIIQAQELIQPPCGLHVILSTDVVRTNAVPTRINRLHAMAVSVSGKCDCSQDGVTFTQFECGHIFEAGAIIRTGEGARADLVLKHSGTTVRLQARTEIRFDRITVTVKDRHPSEHTLLDLRAGRIFTIVRSAATDSTLEIRNAAGRSVVEGSGGGKYIIAADGTHVSAIGSVVPIKLMGENGITMIAAGQQFTKHDGKLRPLDQTPYNSDLAQLDELQASINGPAPGGPQPK